MAHFAQIDENNVVISVVVVNNAELLDEHGAEQEQKGIDFLVQWSNGYTNWRQTSYNANFRKNYAGIGYIYRQDIDAFIPHQPYASWVLDEATAQWNAPVAYPDDGHSYRWNEDNLEWVRIEEPGDES